MHLSTEPTVVYIAGYGRSGSTILDVVLGSHPNITSTGELGKFWRLYDQERDRCSCGDTYAACAFWSRVVRRVCVTAPTNPAQFDEVAVRIESWYRLPLLLGSRSMADDKRAYADLAKRLLGAIHTISGNAIIVDSSNTAYSHAWRAVALSRLCGLRVRVVHLVRDGRAVLSSRLKGSNTRMRLGLDGHQKLAAPRGLAGWIVANTVAILTRSLLPRGDYQLVHYEDLVTDPAIELQRLGRFLGLDLAEGAQRIRARENFQVGHMVAGNRLIRSSPVRVRTDVEPPDRLRLRHRIAYALVAWPLNLYFAAIRRHAQ